MNTFSRRQISSIFFKVLPFLAVSTTSACGQRVDPIEQPIIRKFGHAPSQAFFDTHDFELPEIQPFLNDEIIVTGVMRRYPDETFDIGTHLYTRKQTCEVIIEKLELQTPNYSKTLKLGSTLALDRLETDFDDVPLKNRQGDLVFYGRVLVEERLDGKRIPLTAEKFVLVVTYRKQTGPEEVVYLTFENTSFLGPVL